MRTCCETADILFGLLWFTADIKLKLEFGKISFGWEAQSLV